MQTRAKRVSICAAAIAAGVLVLSGCSYNVSGTPTYADAGVQRLYDYPASAKYENLGLHAWGFYRPSFAEPGIADVWDDLSSKVKETGGNACIVRHEKVGGLTARTLEVTCEVLRVG
jgi:hypothetical protein